jgi:hypothetical protein
MRLSTHLAYVVALLTFPAFAFAAPWAAWPCGAAFGFLAALYANRERDERAWRERWPGAIRVPQRVADQPKGGRRANR